MFKQYPYIILLLIFSGTVTTASSQSREFYQLKIYHLKNKDQERTVENYLQHAFLPALHKKGMKAGVFKPVVVSDTAISIYVFIPFNSYRNFSKLDAKLAQDKIYNQQGKAYLDAEYTNPPYDRIETILLNAFSSHPHYTVPPLTSPHKDRVYELRSYEGHSENISKNKIEMFNKGDEVGLFERLGFNAVFYGEVEAGSRMPNLMYLTTFENKADRDAHWTAFSKDPAWKTLSGLPQYQHNVSKNVTLFLYPADYSDL